MKCGAFSYPKDGDNSDDLYFSVAVWITELAVEELRAAANGQVDVRPLPA